MDEKKTRLKTKSIACLLLFSAITLSGIAIRNEPILSTDIAEGILKNSINEAKRQGYYVSITIVDKSGKILLVWRDDNAGIHTLSASFKKAYTANSQKRETSEILRGIKNGSIPEDIRFLDENFSMMPGGIPIKINNIVVGGIGVGGAHGEEDVKIARTGLQFITTLEKSQ